VKCIVLLRLPLVTAEGVRQRLKSRYRRPDIPPGTAVLPGGQTGKHPLDQDVLTILV
jgi:hypothetical protein